MTRDEAKVTGGRANEYRNVQAVYAAHGKYVWLTLQRLGVARSDLEDMCQEVFVVVHQRLDSYDPSARMTAWLFGICLRVASGYRRRAHRRYESSTDMSAHDRTLGTQQDPGEQLEGREASKLLYSLLDELELEKRSVFVMFEIDELPCAEIAEQLGIPTGTVYSRLHAARKQLTELAARMRARGGPDG